jgi:hypothetical protein
VSSFASASFLFHSPRYGLPSHALVSCP